MVDYLDLILRESPVVKELLNRVAALEATAATGVPPPAAPRSRRAFYREQLLKGELTSEEIIQLGKRLFPDKDVKMSDVHWYARDLRLEGRDVPKVSEYDARVLRGRKKR